MTVSALHPRSANRRLTCAADLTEALGIDFSDQQLAAITAPLEPGVIIAGAGSGKTTVMAARVVWLVGTGAVRPEEVLGLTFTRKAAAELSARVRAALLRAGVVSDSGIDESGEQLIMTYDAFAARLVSEHGLRLGFEADPTLISGATRFRLAARVVKAAAGPFEFISRLRPATVTERVLKLDADLRQHLVDPAQLDLHARSYLVALESAPTNNRGNPYADVKRAIVAAQERLELASLVQDYQELKMRLGLVEFADQMAIAARLATEVPAVPRALRQAFHVVLLDEYQDTSAAQAIMLQGLFSGATPSQGLGHPVTAVGDPFQAIYGWRGAAASNILQFADDFRTVTGQRSRRFALTVNRRSGQSILDVANVLSRPLRARTTTMLAGGAADAPLPARPGVAGSGVSGSGVAGSGVAGSGPAGRGSTDSGPAGRGPTDSGLAEPGRAERAPAGADLAESGPAESGPAEPALVEATGGDAAGLGLLRAPADARPGQVRAATFDTWEEEVAWVCDSIVAAREQGVARQWADIAVLTRRNADIAPLYAELTARDVPVEIVGLGGLLHLPEVMDTLATLRLVDDVTANPDLLRLLSGPRWHVGPRDLALLGRRARELARDHQAQVDEGEGDALLLALEQAVADVDPTEVVCLLDALESPGDAGYSAEALSRFRRLAGELGALRAHADEPLLDLTRRVLVTLGLDVELMATPEFNRTARRDQIGAFLDAVADYVDVDGDASLTGLLSYFQAEVDQGAGLDQAVPSDREAVKLLTVHKAKGLEWEVVFLPALMKGVFPSDRVTDNWVTTPAALPAELRGDAASIPQLAEATNNAMSDYKRQLSAEQLMAEDRLAYVAVTRAKQLLVGSGHWWRRDLTNPRVTSTYLRSILAEAAEQGQLVAEAAPPAATNPLVSESVPRPWPQPLDPAALTLRQGAAAMVQQARERRTRTGSYEPAADAQEQLLLDGEETVAGWDADIERLVAEVLQARSGRQLVELPSTLSATAMLRLAEDPDAFAAELARPMPRPPSRAARFGTRFHQWVEHHFAGGLTSGRVGQQQLVDPDELADRADAGAHGEAELRELCQQFAAGQFGETVPYAVEAPFTLLLAGRLIRGRIDAVYELGGDEPGGDEPGVDEPGGDEPGVDELSGNELSGDQRRQLTGWRYRVVDWKTNQSDTADPLQLAVYRLAWAEICSLPVDQVDAVFYYVRQDRVVRPSRLPGRTELEGLLRDP